MPPGSSTVEVVLVADGADTIVNLIHRDLPSGPRTLPPRGMGALHGRTCRRPGPMTTIDVDGRRVRRQADVAYHHSGQPIEVMCRRNRNRGMACVLRDQGDSPSGGGHRRRPPRADVPRAGGENGTTGAGHGGRLPRRGPSHPVRDDELTLYGFRPSKDSDFRTSIVDLATVSVLDPDHVVQFRGTCF
jgi:hypothetical protein